MITLVKFNRNLGQQTNPKNKIITRTLGKPGVLSWPHVWDHQKCPTFNEFWYVEIIKEIGGNTPKGVFVLNPLERVAQRSNGRSDVIRLIPGTYDIIPVGNTLLVYPHKLYDNRLGPNWVCSRSVKKTLFNLHKKDKRYNMNSIIVVFDKAEDWTKEDLYQK